MNIEKLFPASYAKTNVDKILHSLRNARINSPTNPVCVLAPAGYGKTHILRYLAYNKKYKSRFYRCRRIEFIYVDMHEVMIEKVSGSASYTWVKDYAPGTIALEKVLYRKFIHKYQRLKNIKRTTPKIENSTWSTEKLISQIEKLTEKYPYKIFYIILDDIEEIFQDDTHAISNLIKYIRDQYRGQIEFIFSLDSSDWFKNTKLSTHGEIANYINQKVIMLSLMNFHETNLYINSPLRRIVYGLKLLNPSVKKSIKYIQFVSGGYLPYKKYLLSSEIKNYDGKLTPPLINISEKLVQSLTSKQVNLLLKVALGEKIRGGWNTNFLIETGLLNLKDGKVSIFSPIFKSFLLSKNSTL